MFQTKSDLQVFNTKEIQKRMKICQNVVQNRKGKVQTLLLNWFHCVLQFGTAQTQGDVHESDHKLVEFAAAHHLGTTSVTYRFERFPHISVVI